MIFRFVLSVFLIVGCSSVEKERSLSSSKRILFLGIDGLSRETFDYARKELDLFKSFNNYSTHVSPFPSISGYSWNKIMQVTKVYGDKGRLKFPESTYFDEYTHQVDSDMRNYFIEHAHPFHFSRSLPKQMNTFVGVAGYKSPTYVRLKEIESIEEQILEAKEEVIGAYAPMFDGIAHLHGGYQEVALTDLDKLITRLERKFENRGEDVEIIIVSDHGQASRFKEGEKELPLIPVNITDVIEKAGYNHSRYLKKEKDVMPSILALANYVPLQFKSKKEIRNFVKKIRDNDWFSIAVNPYVYESLEEARAYTKRYQKSEVWGAKSYGTIVFDKEENLYQYNKIEGDPLEEENIVSGRWYNKKELFDLTAQSTNPDAIYRIADYQTRVDLDTIDLVVTLKNEYMTDGSLSKMVTMIRTHGSLGARATNGVLASNRNETIYPEFIRTEDILEVTGVDAHEMMGLTHNYLSGEDSIVDGEVKVLEKGKHVKAEKFTKALEFSKYLFDIERMQDILKLDENGDLFIAEEEAKKHPKFDNQGFVKKIVTSSKRTGKKIVLGGKKIVTSLYGIPKLTRLVNEARDPKDVKDTRDHKWHKGYLADKSGVSASEIFKEVFKEEVMIDKSFPTRFIKKFTKEPKRLTVLYVPGLYDSIFEGVIFKQAMVSLRDDLGMRILRANVEASCSSAFNAKRIYEQIKRDYEEKILLGEEAPEYIVLSYSKGSVDFLRALAMETEFLRDKIKAMVSIASPLKGAEIVEKSDLQPFIVNALSVTKPPKTCSKGDAGYSVRRKTMINFWRYYGQKIKGAIPYFSISFKSDFKNAHPWMQATKLMWATKVLNDGVVSLASSKFPSSFGATDLGVVEADHLAGMVGTDFPQRAFFRSLLITLAELGTIRSEREGVSR